MQSSATWLGSSGASSNLQDILFKLADNGRLEKNKNTKQSRSKSREGIKRFSTNIISNFKVNRLKQRSNNRMCVCEQTKAQTQTCQATCTDCDSRNQTIFGPYRLLDHIS